MLTYFLIGFGTMIVLMIVARYVVHIRNKRKEREMDEARRKMHEARN